MSKKFRLSLQWFAGEGAAPAGEGGEGGTDAAQIQTTEQDDAQRLGIPADKVEKFRASQKRRNTAAAPKQEQQETAQTEGQAPAAETENPRRTLRDLMKDDQELNREVQGLVQDRLREFAASQEQAKKQLQAIAPAMEVLGRKYGMLQEGKAPDIEAISKAILDDDEMYEERAAELGTDVATARRMDELERIAARAKEREQQDLEQQQARAHIQKLINQGEEMKQLFPDFDLRREMENETFRRWTGPQIGMSVKDAFFALHREEIQRAQAEALAQQMQQKMANAIAAGANRPNETGRAQSASVGMASSQTMTREEREALKKRIYAGEKILPGYEFG